MEPVWHPPEGAHVPCGRDIAGQSGRWRPSLASVEHRKGGSSRRNKSETLARFHSRVNLDVALVRWPSGEAKRRELAEQSVPRLLLVDHDAEPPRSVDPLEDWVRLPVSDEDTRARVSSLAARVETLSPLTPIMETNGELRHRRFRIELSPLQQRLIRPMVNEFGAVVSREALVSSAWPDRLPASNALDVHIGRLRRRLAPAGLEIRTVRSRGYLLTASD